LLSQKPGIGVAVVTPSRGKKRKESGKRKGKGKKRREGRKMEGKKKEGKKKKKEHDNIYSTDRCVYGIHGTARKIRWRSGRPLRLFLQMADKMKEIVASLGPRRLG
jgi:hypothetical protein